MTSLPALQCNPAIEQPSMGRIVIPEADLRNRTGELARRISSDYQARELTLVGVLKGAQFFACDLGRALTIPVLLDFVALSPYQRADDSEGIRITHDVNLEVLGRDLLLVEDIVDTGFTLNFLLDHFRVKQPRSLRVCTLLDRPGLRLAEVTPDYVGFQVDDGFLVGYGLDFRGRFRNLPFIAALD